MPREDVFRLGEVDHLALLFDAAMAGGVNVPEDPYAIALEGVFQFFPCSYIDRCGDD